MGGAVTPRGRDRKARKSPGAWTPERRAAMEARRQEATGASESI
jgi:hypothetical protein